MIALARLKRRNTGHVLLFFTLLFVVMLIVMNLLALELSKKTGETIFDFSFNYSPELAYKMIANYGKEGILRYQYLLKLDMLFPIIYMLFGVSLISYLLNMFFPNNDKLNSLLFLPMLGQLFDWLENGMIFLMLTQFPKDLALFSQFSKLFTILKFLFLNGTILAALLLTIIGLLKTRVIKKN